MTEPVVPITVLQTIDLPNGNKLKTYNDGDTVFEFSDGRTAWVLNDDKVSVHFPDGREVSVWPDGAANVEFPDGREAWVWPDGTFEMKTAECPKCGEIVESTECPKCGTLIGDWTCTYCGVSLTDQDKQLYRENLTPLCGQCLADEKGVEAKDVYESNGTCDPKVW